MNEIRRVAAACGLPDFRYYAFAPVTFAAVAHAPVAHAAVAHAPVAHAPVAFAPALPEPAPVEFASVASASVPPVAGPLPSTPIPDVGIATLPELVCVTPVSERLPFALLTELDRLVAGPVGGTTSRPLRRRSRSAARVMLAATGRA